MNDSGNPWAPNPQSSLSYDGVDHNGAREKEEEEEELTPVQRYKRIRNEAAGTERGDDFFFSTIPSLNNFTAPLRFGSEGHLFEDSTDEESVDDSDSNLARADTSCRPLDSLDLEGIARYIIQRNCRNIVVMTGAGVSVSAGIPDFRSPGTGLYDNLQKYNLPTPEAVFNIHFFRRSPTAFYTLARELYPGNFSPTPAHYFIKLLHDQGRLLRNYTQNIDGLERLAGIPAEKLVEAHGTFSSTHCIQCGSAYSPDFVKSQIFEGRIPYCTAPALCSSSSSPSCDTASSTCRGYVKPDIVFFGESLPRRFFQLYREDFRRCDLLIVMGTSLQVHPFAGLIDEVADHVPRLLINLEPAGVAPRLHITAVPSESDGKDQSSDTNSVCISSDSSPLSVDSDDVDDISDIAPGTRLFKSPDGSLRLLIEAGAERLESTLSIIAQLRHATTDKGFRFHHSGNIRDVFVRGTTDSGVLQLASLLGMSDYLQSLMSRSRPSSPAKRGREQS